MNKDLSIIALATSLLSTFLSIYLFFSLSFICAVKIPRLSIIILIDEMRRQQQQRQHQIATIASAGVIFFANQCVPIRWAVVGICVFAQHTAKHRRCASSCSSFESYSDQPNKHDHKYVFYQHVFDVYKCVCATIWRQWFMSRHVLPTSIVLPFVVSVSVSGCEWNGEPLAQSHSRDINR